MIPTVFYGQQVVLNYYMCSIDGELGIAIMDAALQAAQFLGIIN
jgi:hypothetical protein